MIHSNRFNPMVTIHQPPHTVFLAIAEGRRKLVGFTLVELLVSMCVSLMLLGGVVSLFGTLGESVNDSKSNSEMLQTVRRAADKLRNDLGNLSLVPDPAQTMHNPQGFFEYVEGGGSDRNLLPPPEVTLPDPEILDVGAAETTGNWNFNTGIKKWCYANNNLRNYNHSMGNKFVTWTKNGLGAGTYRVSLTWPTEWKRKGKPTGHTDMHWSRVPLTISSSEDSQTVDVDQTQIPSDLSDPTETRETDDNPIMWHHLGEIAVGDDGQLVVQIGPYNYQNGEPKSKHVYADAIRIECLELAPDSSNDNLPPPQMSLKGDCDDVLHFTTKTDEGAKEVVWFCTPMPGDENKTFDDPTKRYRLHRRELIINPKLPTSTTSLSLGFVNSKPDNAENDPERAANSLESLSHRYNRNTHIFTTTGQFQANTVDDYESHLKEEFTDANGVDRTGKTVILENVIGFDVQAYDPEVPIFKKPGGEDGEAVTLRPTDQGYLSALNNGYDIMGYGAFRDLGNHQINFTELAEQGVIVPTAFQLDKNSDMYTADPTGSTYDSWSGGVDYMKDGEVGFDNWHAQTGQPSPDGIPETAEDLRKPPPYDTPLRAIQVEIRTQEPETEQVRTVKIRKFLGKR